MDLNRFYRKIFFIGFSLINFKSFNKDFCENLVNFYLNFVNFQAKMNFYLNFRIISKFYILLSKVQNFLSLCL